MNVLWGVIPVISKEVGCTNPNPIAKKIARQMEFAKSGGFVLLVRGFSSDPEMNTPSVTVLRV